MFRVILIPVSAQDDFFNDQSLSQSQNIYLPKLQSFSPEQSITGYVPQVAINSPAQPSRTSTSSTIAQLNKLKLHTQYHTNSL